MAAQCDRLKQDILPPGRRERQEIVQRFPYFRRREFLD
jgi:hypothetical protein